MPAPAYAGRADERSEVRLDLIIVTHKGMKLTKKKLIFSGSTIEEYSYDDKPLSYDFTVPEQSRTRSRIVVTDEASKQRKAESQQRSLHRTNSILRRLVNTNAWQWFKKDAVPYPPVFVTFTFKENIQNIKEANKIFSNFIKRLNYAVDENNLLKYVVVIEFQKRGAIHYHTIFFNLKFIKKETLAELWRYGHIKIKAIENVNNVGAYISKYMSKNLADSRLDGLKRYFPSRYLHRPIVIKDHIKATRISKLIPQKFLTKEKDFESSYNGTVGYKQYNLGKKQSIFDILPNLRELL